MAVITQHLVTECCQSMLSSSKDSNVRIAAMDKGTRISFLFATRRYLSIFGILLLTNQLGLHLKIRQGTKIGNIVTDQ